MGMRQHSGALQLQQYEWCSVVAVTCRRLSTLYAVVQRPRHIGWTCPSNRLEGGEFGPSMGSTTEEYDHLYKIILVGDATVGKTHLLSRYIRGTLPKTPQSTIGVEFATRTVPLQVGGTVKAQIWDTAGQERYRSITSAHYRRAVGALLVYDITRRATFVNVAKWLEDLRQSGEPDIVVILVGNKVDLVEENPASREVPYATAAQYAQRNGLFFSEASAVSSFNVKHIFEHLLQEIYNQKTKGQALSDAPPMNPGTVGGMQLAPPATKDGGWNGKLAAQDDSKPPSGFGLFSCCFPQ